MTPELIATLAASGESEPPAFEGIYDVPAAARYLLAARHATHVYPVTSRTLIAWIRRGLTDPELIGIPGRELLIAFEDLISLRIIMALRAAGVSWARIRKAERWLRDHTGRARPFATQQLWTESSEVFADFGDLLIAASQHGQIAMSLIKEFLIPVHGLQFENKIAARWEPLKHVLLDPCIQFGEPCINGTRIPTRSVWDMIRAGDSPDLVRDAYDISARELAAAIEWEQHVAA